jgi:prolyl-tRNA synthetase
MIVRRDTFQKTAVKETEVTATVEKLLDEIQNSMYTKAKKIIEEKTTAAQNYDEFKKILGEKGGFIKASWCGNSTCEAKIKEETGATIRVRSLQKEETTSNCVFCGEKGKEIVYFARSY